LETLRSVRAQVSSVSTKIKGGNLLAFATPYYNGYYTNILTPRDVALAPDLSYMYVGDWELFLVFGYGGQYGDKVGLVRDPFNLQGKQQYLGATTPIEDGYVTSVTLSGDGKRLFTSYGGVGEVLVMDTQALTAAGESMAGQPRSAERVPLDQVAGYNVHITPITVGGLLQGLSTEVAVADLKLQQVGTASPGAPATDQDCVQVMGAKEGDVVKVDLRATVTAANSSAPDLADFELISFSNGTWARKKDDSALTDGNDPFSKTGVFYFIPDIQLQPGQSGPLQEAIGYFKATLKRTNPATGALEEVDQYGIIRVQLSNSFSGTGSNAVTLTGSVGEGGAENKELNV